MVRMPTARLVLFLGASLFAPQIARGEKAAGAGGFSTEDVVFANGEVRLAGRLYLPSGARRPPAVIFTHGSGDAGRESPRYVEEATFLAGSGIAVLIYDKRGVGGSSGSWKQASFEDLAGDAEAAYRFLAARADLDARRIGFRGASQAGYVLPIAASRVAPAFLVLLSPPMVKPYDQILYNVEAELRARQFGDREVADALELTQAGLDFARTRQGWERYAELLRRWRSEPWFEIAGGPDDASDWSFAWLAGILDFDPLPFLRQVRCPTLVFLAGHDAESPVERARELIEGAWRESGAGGRVVFYPEADHDLKRRDAQGRRALERDYLPTLRDWILGSPPAPR